MGVTIRHLGSLQPDDSDYESDGFEGVEIQYEPFKDEVYIKKCPVECFNRLAFCDWIDENFDICNVFDVMNIILISGSSLSRKFNGTDRDFALLTQESRFSTLTYLKMTEIMVASSKPTPKSFMEYIEQEEETNSNMKMIVEKMNDLQKTMNSIQLYLKSNRVDLSGMNKEPKLPGEQKSTSSPMKVSKSRSKSQSPVIEKPVVVNREIIANIVQSLNKQTLQTVETHIPKITEPIVATVTKPIEPFVESVKKNAVTNPSVQTTQSIPEKSPVPVLKPINAMKSPVVTAHPVTNPTQNNKNNSNAEKDKVSDDDSAYGITGRPFGRQNRLHIISKANFEAGTLSSIGNDSLDDSDLENDDRSEDGVNNKKRGNSTMNNGEIDDLYSQIKRMFPNNGRPAETVSTTEPGLQAVESNGTTSQSNATATTSDGTPTVTNPTKEKTTASVQRLKDINKRLQNIQDQLME